jgi:hypothetical protein
VEERLEKLSFSRGGGACLLGRLLDRDFAERPLPLRSRRGSSRNGTIVLIDAIF